MTPAGVELATFRFVEQHLSHCAIAVPTLYMYLALYKQLISNFKCCNFNNRNTQQYKLRYNNNT